jgi:hypothetical protein
MNKREFMRATGLLGAATFLPVKCLFGSEASPSGTCVLTPRETDGPFPLDLTANAFYYRQDVRESQTGVPLRLRLRIIGDQNCGVMPNLRVNIWHCSRVGLYSGYSQPNNAGQAGQTYLRGYQFTDADGEVEFLTVFPGWYNGRICHIHFQVYVNSNYAAISQLSFPITEKNAIYLANGTLYPNGVDPLTFSQDNIFNNGYQYQLATLEANDEGGYDAFLEVTIQGTGDTTTGYMESQVEQHFELGQNIPNPYVDSTVVPITLKQSGDVLLDLWDVQGRKVATVKRNRLGVGEHRIELNMAELGLSAANYAYQVQVTNANGTWRTAKMMTARR